MDSSITRRGQPCWYRVEGVGLTAVNDSLILEGAIFQMIRKHFRNDPYYVDLVDLLHEVRYPYPILDRRITLSYRSHIKLKWDNSSTLSPPPNTQSTFPNFLSIGTPFLLYSLSSLSNSPQAQDNCRLQDGHLLFLPPRRACPSPLRFPRREEEPIGPRLL